VDAGTEHLPQVLVTTLVDQVEVDLAEGRQEAVGVVQGGGRAVVGHLQPVAGHVGDRQHPDPDSLVLVAELDPFRAVGDDHRRRERLERPHRDPSAVRVRTQHRVRVAVLTGHQQVQLLAGNGQRRSHEGLTRERASSGMDTHVGRLRASYTVS
jgi:hypothetical protein